MVVQRLIVGFAASASMALCAVGNAQCPPAVPNLWYASQGSSCAFIDLEWSEVQGANIYNIYRNTTGNYSTSSWVGSALFGDTFFTDVLASSETKYYYWVTAKRNLCWPGTGTSGPSNVAVGWRGQPWTPTQVHVSEGNCNGVHVTWDQLQPAGAAATVFRIYRHPSNTYLLADDVGTVPGSHRSFIDPTAIPGWTYWYWVRAESDCGTAASESDSGATSTGPAPSNNLREYAIPVSNGSFFGNTHCATSDGTASCGLSWNSPDVWYRYTAPADGNLNVRTCTSANYDTVLSIHLPGVGPSFVCNDDSCGIRSEVNTPVTSGQEYFIRVAGRNGDTGAFHLDVTGPQCYPDCNGNGSLSVADFTCFQTRFVTGDPYADCNESGALTVADFTCFQTQFVAGCP